jgi:hypothetical protein
MKQDRFLLGILLFIVLLVIAAVALFFIRQDTQSYLPEDTPDGVIYNYALALQNGDFEHAYSYLADQKNKPDYTYFRQAFLSRQLDLSSNAIRVGEVANIDDTEALVTVTVLYASSGPFAEGWSSTETATLLLQDGSWKISYMPYPYWGWDWYQVLPAPVK